MSTKVIRKFRTKRFIFTAGLRRDGKRSFSVASDWRDGGTVIVAITTPGVIVAVFDAPRLDAYADACGECGVATNGEGKTYPLHTFSWDEDGNETESTEDTLLCANCFDGYTNGWTEANTPV